MCGFASLVLLAVYPTPVRPGILVSCQGKQTEALADDACRAGSTRDATLSPSGRLRRCQIFTQLVRARYQAPTTTFKNPNHKTQQPSSPAMLSTFAIVLFGAGIALGASEPPESTVEPTLTAIEATAATASPLSPLSSVKGLAFDRFFQVWMENTVRIHTMGAV